MSIIIRSVWRWVAVLCLAAVYAEALEVTLWGFNNADNEQEIISAGKGLSFGQQSSGENGAPYVVEGKRSLVLSWDAPGTYSITLNRTDTTFDLGENDRLQLDLFVKKNGVIPTDITIDHPGIGTNTAKNELGENQWNLITFAIEGEKRTAISDDITLSFTVDNAGSIAIDNIRITPLIPDIYDASGHEKRIDLRWNDIFTSGLSHYVVYRSEAQKNSFVEIDRFIKKTRYPDKANNILPAIFDFVGSNGVTYDYKVGAVISGIEYVSDPVQVTSKKENDDEFLEGVQIACASHFWQLPWRYAGLSIGNGPTIGTISSNSGATGFEMASLISMIERGYLTRQQVAERILLVLRFLKYHGYRENGFFGHRLDAQTGEWIGGSIGISENAFLATGMLTARQYFNSTNDVETEIREITTDLYEAMDWTWPYSNSETLWWGYEDGGWNMKLGGGFNESFNTYLLAIASPTHPIPDSSWITAVGGDVNGTKIYGYRHWFSKLERMIYYESMAHFGMEPHFADFNGFYADNVKNVMYAHREYHIENPFGYKNYGDLEWGQNVGIIDTSADPDIFDPNYNGDQPYKEDHGNISPLGVSSILPFAPEIVIPTLRHMYDTYGSNIINPWGWFNKYNATENTFGLVTSSIDISVVAGQIENYKTGTIWSCFLANPEIHDAMKRINMSRHPEAGLNVALYHITDDGSWNTIPDLSQFTPVETEKAPIISHKWRNRDDNYGQRYHGFLKIDTTGSYTFYASGNKGARLKIDNSNLLEVFQGTNFSESITVTLEKGFHDFELEYYRGTRGTMALEYEGPGIDRQVVPVTAFRRSTKNASPEWFGAKEIRIGINTSCSLTYRSYDADYDPLTITIVNKPTWMTITDNGDGSCSTSGTPGKDDMGTKTFSLFSSDGTSPACTLEVTVHVTENDIDNTEESVAIIERPKAVPSAQFELFPNPVASSDNEVAITIPGTINGPGSVTIYDVLGNVVHTQQIRESYGSFYTWDLRNRAGRKVSSGMYLVVVRFEDPTRSKPVSKLLLGIQK